MGDTLSGLLGFALIAGLFVAFGLQRRAQKRRSAAPPVVAEPVVDTSVTVESGAPSSSPNWGMPIVYCLLLAGADAYRGGFWGYLWQGVFFAVIALAAYSTFSPRELAAEQVRRPETTRAHQVVMLGVPYLLVPLIGWTLVVIVQWGPGVFVPAVPWVVLALLGIAAAFKRS